MCLVCRFGSDELTDRYVGIVDILHADVFKLFVDKPLLDLFQCHAFKVNEYDLGIRVDAGGNRDGKITVTYGLAGRNRLFDDLVLRDGFAGRVSIKYPVTVYVIFIDPCFNVELGHAGEVHQLRSVLLAGTSAASSQPEKQKHAQNEFHDPIVFHGRCLL